MTDIRETQLPGVGVRLDFTTSFGDHIGVIVYHGGRRELVVYGVEDPDMCTTVLHMGPDDAHILNEALGGSQVVQVTNSVEQDIDGLSIEWLRISEHSASAGKSIGDGMIRARTGVSIVAVVRGSETIPSPRPEFVFEVDDVAVAVGTPNGIAEARAILES